MKLKNVLMMTAALTAMGAEAAVITSPNGKLVVTTDINTKGTPVYSVKLDGKTVVENSPLGLVTDFADLSQGLSEKSSKSEAVNRSYEQDKIKKSHVDVNATSALVEYEGADGKRLDVEWHVADNGVAFRYRVPRINGKGSMVVKEEVSSFDFPDGTTAFLTSQSDPMIGWKRTKPSYEEYYFVDVPMTQKSEYGRGFTFPALFKTADENWVLLTETGVDGYYCASHLNDYKDGKYWSVNCNKYARDPRRHLCYPHFFPYDKLEEKIMSVIKTTCQKYLDSLNIKELSEKVLQDRAKEKNDRQKEKQQLLNEIEELKRKSDALYDDKFNGIISVDTYTRMYTQTEKQISALNYRIYEIDNEENQIKEDTKEIAKHEEQIKSLLNLDEPNRELIKTLVKNIYIDKDRNIEIQYRFKVLDDIKTNYEEIN